MANDTCPHCGAAADTVRNEGLNWFDCGTTESNPEQRGIQCYRNQLATVTAERDTWRNCGAYWYSEWRHASGNKTAPKLTCDELAKATVLQRDAERHELAELRRRLAEAPVWWTKPEAVHCDPSYTMVTLHEGPIPGGAAFRLVRDDTDQESMT